MKKAFLILIISFVLPFASGISAQTRSAKRGVSFNFTNDADLAALQTGTSWFYNWGPAPNNVTNSYNSIYGYEFCPMAWNGGYNADAIRTYVQAHPDCRYILAFNEPNFTDQANMTPQQAAAAWPALKALAQELNLQIISPACNYSSWTQYSAPYKWLDEFFAQPGVSIDDVAGIAIHSYMGWAVATNGYVQEYIDRYNKPLWLTEFCAWDNFQTNNGGTALQQRKEMIDMIDFLEQNPMVARYAWFIPRRDEIQNPAFPYMELLTNTNGTEKGILTETGQVWTYMSSYDNNFYHNTDAIIEAEHYIYKSKGVYIEQTSDTAGILDIYDFSNLDTLKYNVNIPTADNYTFRLRLLSNADAMLKIVSSGGSVSFPVASTSNLWADAELNVPLSAGNQQISLILTQGNMKLNYFVITNNGANPPPNPNPPGSTVNPPPEGNNLALNKPTTASSEYNHPTYGLLAASNATDGDMTTRWGSNEINNQNTQEWIMVDLQENYSISNILIFWESAYASAFNIEISPDGTNWTQFYSTSNFSGGNFTLTDDAQNVRFIKINCTKKGFSANGTYYGYSIYEIEVYGVPTTQIQNNEHSSDVEIFPNPVNDFLNIKADKNISSVILSDISGKTVLGKQRVNSLNMSDIAAGIYFLTIKLSDKTTVVKKVIVR